MALMGLPPPLGLVLQACVNMILNFKFSLVRRRERLVGFKLEHKQSFENRCLLPGNKVIKKGGGLTC